MATSPLLLQIADRTANFIRHTGISQGQLCRHLSVSDSSLSQFLHGTKSLDPSVIIKLCQTLSLSHQEVVEKFSQQQPTSRIMHLQGRGRGMTMANDGWQPGGAGHDPNDDGRTIDDVPDATSQNALDQATEDLLRKVRMYHRKSARLISDYIQQATANRQGSTPIPADAPKFSRS